MAISITGGNTAPGGGTYATTSDITAAVAAVIDSSPATLDTLNELAAALGDDANFAGTMTTALAAKAPLASPTFTGHPTIEGVTSTGATGTGALVFGTAPTFTTSITTPAVISSDITGMLQIGGTTTTGSVRIGGSFTTGTIDIGTGTTWTTGSINIGTGAMSSGTKTINIGTGGTGTLSGTINIGSINQSSSVINLNGTVYSNATTFIKSLENGNGNTSGINLFPSQTTGAVNIANGTTFAANLNLASGVNTSGTKYVWIGANTGAGGASSINIGSNGNASSTTSITIGSNAGTSTTIMHGTVYAATYAGASSASNAALFGNTTSGSITIGGALSTGTLNIGTSSAMDGIINIGTGAISVGTKTINIGSGGTGGTTNINIGSSSGSSTTLTLNANTYADAIYARTSSSSAGIHTNVTTGSTQLATGLTTGTLSIATANGFVGTLNIATGQTASGSTKTVNIATGGLSGSNAVVNIGSVNGTTTSLYGTVVLANTSTPAVANGIGTTGQIAWDTNYLYVCVSTNTWKRVALSTW